MLLYRLTKSLRSIIETAAYAPPKLLHAVEANDAFDILHPALSGSHTRCLRYGGLGKGGNGGLGHIPALCLGRVEP
jgi:hypothetical protein